MPRPSWVPLVLLLLVTVYGLNQLTMTVAPTAARRVNPFHVAVATPFASHLHAVTAARDQLSEALRRGRLFTSWLLEFQTADWQRARAASASESDLIEARFHVANAEVLGEAMRQDRRATGELTQADEFLRAAEPLLSPSMADELTVVRQRIAKAKLLTEADLDTAIAGFNTIKDDLDDLIDALHSANS